MVSLSKIFRIYGENMAEFENMEDNADMLRDEERITKVIKKVFKDEFKKQEQNLAKIISGNLE